MSNSQHGYYEKKFDIDYSARFNKKQVGVRDLYKTDKFDGKNIFGDTPYIKGTIEEILDPVALFRAIQKERLNIMFREKKINGEFIFS